VVYKNRGLDEYICRIEGTQHEAGWYPSDSLCLINRKGVTSSMLPEAAHVKLKMVGAARKVELFHWMLACLDPDWPWKAENGYTPLKHCGACAGAIYPQPNFTANDIRNLAKQIDQSTRIAGGLRVDIKKYNVQARCTKVAGEDQDPATEVDTTEDKPTTVGAE
jgi:hypothetical protein